MGLRRRRLLGTAASATFAGVAGCGSETDASGDSTSPQDRGPLEIAELAFATARPADFGEYEPQPEATYALDDTVWIYVALGGVAASRTAPEETAGAGDGQLRTDLREHVVVESPGGGTVRDRELRHDEVVESEELDRFYVTHDLRLTPSGEPGTYAVTVEFSDAVSGTGDSRSDEFRVTE